jgi:hypothetical protein
MADVPRRSERGVNGVDIEIAVAGADEKKSLAGNCHQNWLGG